VDCKSCEPPRPDHASVDLVGYTPHRFIVVRNSWSKTLWGDKGFAYASTLHPEPRQGHPNAGSEGLVARVKPVPRMIELDA
jgi:hypothetical protein